MFDTTRMMRSYVDTVARRIGSTHAQWALMAILVRQPGLTQAELAEILEIQPISLTRLVDRLSEQGLVERRAHPTDRRANSLFITEAGLLVMEARAPLETEITDSLFAGVDSQALATFQTVLEHLRANLRDGTPGRTGGHRPDALGIQHAS